jgi:YidC/Oxa1 family membrane protein insertase
MSIIGTPLGYIMWACYQIVKNYGLSIILFTLSTKILLFPVSLKIQKNSVKLVQMKPKIEELKKQYPNKEDKEAFMDAQMELFKEEKYSPAAGCLPMLIQLPIILGLIDVIYKPLKHLLHLPSDIIKALETIAAEVLHADNLGITAQLRVIEMTNDSVYIDKLAALGNIGGMEGESIIWQIQNVDLDFLGLDLSSVPSITEPGILLLIPALSGLSSLALSILQNRGGNILQAEQGAKSQLGMTLFLTLFSLYFTFLVPAGIGLYWIMSNVFAILQMYLLNKIYNPKKYIDYEALEKMKQEKRTDKEKKLEQKKADNGQSLRQREKQDYKKFFKTKDKHIVFYSEKSGFYKYFENVIEELSRQTDIFIHYVTSDPNDAIFSRENPQIMPYYIGGKRLIPFMMKMDADIVIMTMPDLEQMHIKRSLVREDVEYIYLFHWVLSTHMVVRKGALDHYDTIFCVGRHQIEEIRETEKIYGLKTKKLIECGYGVIENMRKQYFKEGSKTNEKKSVLIAPSWQTDNIMESCLDELLQGILDKGYHIVLRPHPEYIKRYKKDIDNILKRYNSLISKDFQIETDFASNVSVYNADILITDWSNIAYEFALTTKKPPLFINTPMKIMNPEYKRLSMEPLDITLRNEIGKSLEPNQLNTIHETIQLLLSKRDNYQEKIEEVINTYFFPFENSGRTVADYIIERLNNKKEEETE